jgi:hypothetical protein
MRLSADNVPYTQVCHRRHAFVVGRGHFDDGREDRRHRVVHPHIDRAQLRFYRRGHPLHLVGVCDVGLQRQRGAPEPSHVCAAASRPAKPRATSPTAAPPRANAQAVARPTPADAPVTTTTSDALWVNGRTFRRLVTKSFSPRDPFVGGCGPSVATPVPGFGHGGPLSRHVRTPDRWPRSYLPRDPERGRPAGMIVPQSVLFVEQPTT